MTTQTRFESIGWKIAEARTQTYPYQIRFRQFGDQLPLTGFSRRLNVFWSMVDFDDQGYPTQTELARLHAFEERLVNAVEMDDLAVLVAVVTGRGEREFVFYTSDPREFVRRLSQMPQETERYPIKIHENEDPQWDYYRSEIGAIRDQGL